LIVIAGRTGLTAVGRVVHASQRTGVAEASVTDAHGALCATTSTTCLIFDMLFDMHGIEQDR
jgi:acyl-coenzyme A thioesterase PaaI-like protein